MAIEYVGYKTVEVTADELAYFYSHQTENIYACLVNQYLVLTQNDIIVDRLKWTGEQYVTISYRNIANDYTGKISPRNLQQELAFDMLQDQNTTIKVIAGGYGSGKDYCMISTALDFILKKHKYEKIIWVRNNVEVKNTSPVGFLPGSLLEKLGSYAMIIADHVGGESGLNMLIAQGKVELQHLGLIRGRDLKNSIIMCSEAENMTKEHIQLLIGRVGEGSMLWLNGDWKQTDKRVFEDNNGLLTVIKKLQGHKRFGYVKFEKTERSETAAMADLLD